MHISCCFLWQSSYSVLKWAKQRSSANSPRLQLTQLGRIAKFWVRNSFEVCTEYYFKELPATYLEWRGREGGEGMMGRWSGVWPAAAAHGNECEGVMDGGESRMGQEGRGACGERMGPGQGRVQRRQLRVHLRDGARVGTGEGKRPCSRIDQPGCVIVRWAGKEQRNGSRREMRGKEERSSAKMGKKRGGDGTKGEEGGGIAELVCKREHMQKARRSQCRDAAAGKHEAVGSAIVLDGDEARDLWGPCRACVPENDLATSALTEMVGVGWEMLAARIKTPTRHFPTSSGARLASFWIPPKLWPGDMRVLTVVWCLAVINGLSGSHSAVVPSGLVLGAHVLAFHQDTRVPEIYSRVSFRMHFVYALGFCQAPSQGHLVVLSRSLS
ncbi:hypothetical protein B0H14DRAFT_2607964 [Mycena olivaceomarginata]|nr:hypothetical protein B0H14DRAFT_2607964 [Mycena olivaceomarginata]